MATSGTASASSSTSAFQPWYLPIEFLDEDTPLREFLQENNISVCVGKDELYLVLMHVCKTMLGIESNYDPAAKYEPTDATDNFKVEGDILWLVPTAGGLITRWISSNLTRATLSDFLLPICIKERAENMLISLGFKRCHVNEMLQTTYQMGTMYDSVSSVSSTRICLLKMRKLGQIFCGDLHCNSDHSYYYTYDPSEPGKVGLKKKYGQPGRNFVFNYSGEFILQHGELITIPGAEHTHSEKVIEWKLKLVQ